MRKIVPVEGIKKVHNEVLQRKLQEFGKDSVDDLTYEEKERFLEEVKKESEQADRELHG